MKYLSIAKWFFVVLAILLVIFIAGLNVAAYSFNAPENSLVEYFNKLNTPFEFNYIDFEAKRLRYIKTGNEDANYLLLFIHGAPGTLDNFKSYLADYELRQDYLMVSIDRIGYGGSELGDAEVNIKKQAEAVAEISKQYSGKEIIPIGYSYGGPIAAKFAIDYPELAKGLIMLAPLNDPKNEPMKWYSKVSNWYIVKKILPSFLNVATEEKMAHSESLAKIKADWIDLSVPVMHIHGDADGLAPCESNIIFSQENIRQDLIHIRRYPEMGHMLIWNRAATIKALILEFVQILEDEKL